jgi:hypothetical protein
MGARRRGLSVVVGVFAVLCSAALQGEELKVGDRAPSFKLPGTDG